MQHQRKLLKSVIGLGSRAFVFIHFMAVNISIKLQARWLIIVNHFTLAKAGAYTSTAVLM
jgi:hypothetical protein